MLRKLPPAGYLLALICFLLPFVEVSCNGQKVVSLTGLQLLAGTQVGGAAGGMFGQPAQRVKPETAVVVAFLAGIAALVLSLMNQGRTDIIAGVCGIVAGASLLALQQSIASGAPPQAMGLIQVQYQPGYFLSVGLFFAGAALLFYLAFARQAELSTSLPATRYPAPSPPGSPPVSHASLGHAPTQALPAFGRAGSAPQPLPEATLRFCPHCGQPVVADARFCAKCGAAQP